VGVRDDDQLLALVTRGDAVALAEFYDRHAGWLLLRLSRRCGDAGLVEEIVQDTFMSVWRSAGPTGLPAEALGQPGGCGPWHLVGSSMGCGERTVRLSPRTQRLAGSLTVRSRCF